MSDDNSPSSSPQPGDIRPVVRTSNPSNLGMWLGGAAILIGGFFLFQALSANRESALMPATLAPEAIGGFVSAPTPLSVPGRFLERELEPRPVLRLVRPVAEEAPATQTAPPREVITRIVEREVPAPNPQPSYQPAYTPPVPLVIEAPSRGLSQAEPEIADDGRVLASRLKNPSLTIPQGTIIAAILETALDSTRPGGARAIVARDVLSFDGSRILIPRGSQLYGEYAADVSSGVNRALIQWQRLTRPDGVIINLDSPSADPLGRAGVKGKVDSKFFQRFGSSILQSVLDLGVGLATRQVSDGLIVALPGSTQNVTESSGSNVQPTLKVKQGTSVSVFVARDLDFSSVED